MKTKIKSLCMLALICVFYSASAQDNPQPVASKDAQPVPVAIQGGTGHLINGSCNIVLYESMANETYYVSITAHGQSNPLYIVKEDNFFIVKEGTGTLAADVDFDYVVFENVILRGSVTRNVVSIPRSTTPKQ
jgi:hypothetical protein